MIWRLSTTLMLTVAVGLAAQADDAKDKALKELEGEWQAVEAEVNGKKAPEKQVKELRLVFEGEKITVKGAGGAGGERKKTFWIDPSQSPKHIDITSLDGQEKDQTAACIYKVEKDRLTICMPYSTTEVDKRPKEFKTKDGDGLMLIVLERVKSK